MGKDIQIFNNDQFGQLRTVVIDNEPWFVGKDVAVALGYSRSADALKAHVSDDDKLTRRFTESGQSREMYIINESGVYSLVFGSKLESAKEFKHWVTHDVLPSIRKTGAYQIPQLTPNPHYRTRMIGTAVRDIGKTRDAIMEVFAVKPGMATAVGIETVCESYGIDPAPFRKLIPSEENPGYLNATMIAERMGLKFKTGRSDPAKANKLLESAGLQERHGDKWHLTEKGKAYGEEKPYTRNGHSDYQIVWNDSVFDALRMTKGGV